MKRIIAIVAIIYVVLISCSDKTNENTTVFQNQFEYPVLKLKNVNNVLQINVQLLDTTLGLFVNEFIISTLGTSKINTIESAAIYFNADNSSTINDHLGVLYECSQAQLGFQKFCMRDLLLE